MNVIESRSTVDTKDLRKAFSRFGTGVTIVTTRLPGGACLGVTANSFNTVSLEPPIVLWSLSSGSPSLDAFRRAGRFVVNVLALNQLHLSSQFARPAPDKFAGVEFSEGLSGLPVLKGCAATIECVVVSDREVGDHVLFLGQVERYAHEQTAPLLFCNGSYVQGIDVNLNPGLSG